MKLFENRIFFTPVYHTDIGYDIEQIKNVLSREIFIDRIKSKGKQTRNYDKIEHDCLVDFFQISNTLINSVATQWGIDKSLNLLNYWFNIDRKFDYSLSHYHSEGIISAVYYIQIPSNTSKIVFERPDAQEHYFEGDIDNEYNFKNYSYEAIENRMIIFPSYLKHRVEQNLTTDKDDRRISLSFNYA